LITAPTKVRISPKEAVMHKPLALLTVALCLACAVGPALAAGTPDKSTATFVGKAPEKPLTKEQKEAQERAKTQSNQLKQTATDLGPQGPQKQTKKPGEMPNFGVNPEADAMLKNMAKPKK
jgi:hypothetical protein